MAWGLNDAVGLTDAGTQCPNRAVDQQQVAELLDVISQIPGPLDFGGTPLSALPPIEDGLASIELCQSILRFQAVQGDLVQDSRVDVDGGTWQRLLSMAQVQPEPAGTAVPLALFLSNLVLLELPRNSSGPTSLTFSLKADPIAVFEQPGLRITFSVEGALKVDWSGTFELAMVDSPDFAALGAAVQSGDARFAGETNLKNMSTKFQVESKQAVGNLFTAIKLGMAADGSVTMTGSLGSDLTMFSLGWDEATQEIVYTGEAKVDQFQPVTSGLAKVSGKLRVQIKLRTEDENFEASLQTVIVAALVGGFLLFPVIVELGAAGAAALEAMGEGVTEATMILVPRPI